MPPASAIKGSKDKCESLEINNAILKKKEPFLPKSKMLPPFLHDS